MQLKDKENITQNLLDAGCDDATIKTTLALMELGKYEEVAKLLAGHRDALLGGIHKGEKCICCLDYFIYTLRKEKGEQPK